MKLEKIGIVHSCFKVKFGTPRQGSLALHSRGYIEIEKRWEASKSLQGLEEFSHLWVLFWFHGNTNLTYKPVVRPPRLPASRVGAFASRSPLRPNPIGLSLVKLDRIEGSRVYISSLDLIEGTPVLDIKPYIHEYDSVEDSKCGWVENLSPQKLQVEFTDEAIQQIQSHPYPNLKQTIIDILSSDIRNRNDRSERNTGKILGFYFSDLNILFQTTEGKVRVLKIEGLLADNDHR